MTEPERTVESILADHELRARLVEALSGELEAGSDPVALLAKPSYAFLTGLSSAAVVLLSFLIPSAADLGDRSDDGA